MEYHPLGKTGIRISAVFFGAGPVSKLMVGDDRRRQRDVIGHAIERGVNWFDTAVTYGNGQSEFSLGTAFKELGVAHRVHVATKVRLAADDLVKNSVRSWFPGLAWQNFLSKHDKPVLHDRGHRWG